MSDVLAESVAAIEVPNGYLEDKKPKACVVALEMLADGKGFRAIREETGLSFAGIAALKARHSRALEIRRGEMAHDGFELVEKHRLLINKKLDELAEDEDALRKVRLNDLNLGYAMMQDKAFAALEGNKVTVEHVKKGPTLEDALRAIQEAQRRVREESIDV